MGQPRRPIDTKAESEICQDLTSPQQTTKQLFVCSSGPFAHVGKENILQCGILKLFLVDRRYFMPMNTIKPAHFLRKVATSPRLRGHRAQRGHPCRRRKKNQGFALSNGISRVKRGFVWVFCEIRCFSFSFLTNLSGGEKSNIPAKKRSGFSPLTLGWWLCHPPRRRRGESS